MSESAILFLVILLPFITALLFSIVHTKHQPLKLMAASFVSFAVFLCLLFILLKQNHLLKEGISVSFSFFSLSFQADGFRVFYALLAAAMWTFCLVFSIDYLKGHKTTNRFLFFFLSTLSFVIGVFLAGDLLTLFLFFEAMSFFSYAWVAEEETDAALKASKTYLAVAVIGGLVMLMGIFMLQHAFGTLQINELKSAAEEFLNGSGGNFGNRVSYLFTSGLLLTFGFAAKAGIFPLHIWLPKAHPAAPAPASALLSGMLTKCGIYGVLLVVVSLLYSEMRFGSLLLVLGTITMLLGALLAVFSIDLKRILACSSVSQIGFITLSLGVFSLSGGTNRLAFFGSLYHCVNHSLLKLILFLFAGIVIMKANSLDLTEIKGIGRKHPLLMITVAAGGLSLAGFPGTNGYISKTLIHEGILSCREEMLAAGNAGTASLLSVSEILFLISGGLTLAYMLKMFVAIFVEKGKKKVNDSRISLLTGLPVLLPALLIPVLGCMPDTVFAKIGLLGSKSFLSESQMSEKLLSWFDIENLKGAMISLTIGVIVYFVFIRLCLVKRENREITYVNRLPVWADLENSVFKPVIFGFFSFVLAFLCRICDTLVDAIAAGLRVTVFAPKKRRMSIWVGTKFTHMLGTMFDTFIALLNKSLFHNHPIKKSFVSVFAVSEMEAKQTLNLITGSVSFGLLLAATGLVLTLLYLLF